MSHGGLDSDETKVKLAPAPLKAPRRLQNDRLLEETVEALSGISVTLSPVHRETRGKHDA